METPEDRRELEAYLCRKNDGHLIRIVGPSFDLVASWADRGVPFGVACQGIDRYFERYYAKGPRRRPVRIDFCEADVLDAFDAWRRATGVAVAAADAAPSADPEEPVRRGPSLPAHLERVLRRLTSLRVNGVLDGRSDALLDRVSRELEAVKANAGGVRGDARHAMIERLAALDHELLDEARARLDQATYDAIGREAEQELASFRSGMSAEAFQHARTVVVDRIVRDRAGLPTIAFV